MPRVQLIDRGIHSGKQHMYGGLAFDSIRSGRGGGSGVQRLCVCPCANLTLAITTFQTDTRRYTEEMSSLQMLTLRRLVPKIKAMAVTLDQVSEAALRQGAREEARDEDNCGKYAKSLLEKH